MTGWRPAPRNPEATATYAAVEADRATRPERYRLDADDLAAIAARGRAGDGFAPGWREGLEAYLGSAREDGRLNAVGTAMVTATAIGRLPGRCDHGPQPGGRCRTVAHPAAGTHRHHRGLADRDGWPC